jgi:anti-sigma factor RsiW
MSARDEVAALLPAYAAGELMAADRAWVEAALARSPRLRAELARYERLFALLAAARGEVVPPAGLGGRIARQMVARGDLRAAAGLAGDALGAYGRALVYYLGLGREGV